MEPVVMEIQVQEMRAPLILAVAVAVARDLALQQAEQVVPE